MPPHLNPWFLSAAACNAIAALLHIAIIFGGPAWYRFFGAGEEMARMAERGSLQPHIITFAIAAILAVWALYALTAAGMGFSQPLPLQSPILFAIATIYLLRAMLYIPFLFITHQPVGAFAWWSSAICLMYAVCHIAGILTSSSAPK